MKKKTEKIGNTLTTGFHLTALFAIGATIVWSAILAFADMIDKNHAGIEDILLLFIYLELGAMVGIYFQTNHMPVRFLIYVAITALTRLMIGMVNVSHTADWHILIISGSILLLAIGILILRIGSYKYPAPKVSRHTDLSDPEISD